MKRSQILIFLIALIFAILAVLAVGNQMGFFNDSAHYNVDVAELTNELTIDNSNWNYDEENNIYYQLGIVYCTNPETTEYESLGIFVPGEYFTANENDNGTYTCSVIDGHAGNFSASNAPIVMPINTAGYSAHAAPTSYNPNEVKNFTKAGFIYVDAGCRGKENGYNYSGGAPWGVTDLKAAVLYLKFNGETLPGDSEKIFSFGHSGGGAQSAILGASGDSKLYIPYLESIGAALVDRNGNKISDRICGAMCWCPITSLDTADGAYEWAMGQYSSQGTRGNGTWTNELSDDLAVSYAKYINDLKLKGPDGQTLSLEESDEGIYASGSYYDYIEETETLIPTDECIIILKESVYTQDISPTSDVPEDIFNTVMRELEEKVDKVEGKGLSTNDYTDEDKAKVDNFGIIVDDELSTTSINPVQNNVITTNLQTKAEIVHEHVTADVIDFESSVDVDLDKLLSDLTEKVREL